MKFDNEKGNKNPEKFLMIDFGNFHHDVESDKDWSEEDVVSLSGAMAPYIILMLSLIHI